MEPVHCDYPTIEVSKLFVSEIIAIIGQHSASVVRLPSVGTWPLPCVDITVPCLVWYWLVRPEMASRDWTIYSVGSSSRALSVCVCRLSGHSVAPSMLFLWQLWMFPSANLYILKLNYLGFIIHLIRRTGCAAQFFPFFYPLCSSLSGRYMAPFPTRERECRRFAPIEASFHNSSEVFLLLSSTGHSFPEILSLLAFSTKSTNSLDISLLAEF